MLWKLNLNIKMLRKKSKSTKKPQSTKKKSTIKKISCSSCLMKLGLSVHVQQTLYRRYCAIHCASQYSRIQQELNKPISTPQQPIKEYLQKFYKPVQRKHEFSRVKDIYKLHKDAPRLFMPQITDIVTKCHHRKRLLDYFKIAKVLGLKVESAKTSTFLYSLSKTYRPGQNNAPFSRILGQISAYEFSQEIQKQLIQTLEKGKSEKIDSKVSNSKNKQNQRNPFISLNPQLNVIRSSKFQYK